MKLTHFKNLDGLLAHVASELIYRLDDEQSALEGVAAPFHSDEERDGKAARLDDILRAEPLITHANTLLEAATSALFQLERGDRGAAQRVLRRAVLRAQPAEH
ncbi:hypothetical protein [Endothiovibrio diazotrophicus]